MPEHPHPEPAHPEHPHPPIRTGIIGFGLAGRVFHAPFLAANPAFALTTIATSSPERAAEVRAAHPAARVVPTPEALLAEVLTPLVVAIDAMLDRREAAGKLTPRTRRPFLVEMVDIICDHPDATAIAAFDASIRHRLDQRPYCEQSSRFWRMSWPE